MQTYSVLTDEYAFTAAKTDAFITPSVFNSADKMPTEAENEDENKAVKESEVGTLVDKPLFGVALSATEPCWVAEASVWLGDALPPMSIMRSSVFLHANNPNAKIQASRTATILPNFIKLSLIILFFAAL